MVFNSFATNYMWVLNSLPAIDTSCLLLINFLNSLDSDQGRHNVRPDLDPDCFQLDIP